MEKPKKNYNKLGGGIKKAGLWFDDKKIAAGMVILTVITIIPMLVVAKYSHASADDFGWGAEVRRQVWNETHSILQFLKAAFYGTIDIYYEWQGTFTTTFVQAFQPEIFNVNAYFIVPYIMLSFFLGSTALFLHYLLVVMLGMKKSVYSIVTMLYFLVSIQYIPSTGEAFYWYNGSVAYTLAYSVMLFCLYFSLKFIFSGKKRNLVLAVFTAFFVGGGNYLTVVLLPLLLILILCLFAPSRRKAFYLMIPLAVFGITAIINMKAPGTQVRGGSGFGFDIHNVVRTIGRAVGNGLADVRRMYVNNPVIVLCMIVIALFIASQMIEKQYEFSFRFPLLFVIMTSGSYLAMYAPTYYAGVGAPFGRMSNLISFYFELSLILDIVYVTGYVTKKWNNRWKERCRKLAEKWEVYKIYILLAVAVLILFHPEWYRTTSMARTVDYLASGQAKAFSEAMDRRYEILLNEDLKDVELDPVPSAGPLFNYDVGEDCNVWPNTAVAGFFNKDSVRLKSGLHP